MPEKTNLKEGRLVNFGSQFDGFQSMVYLDPLFWGPVVKWDIRVGARGAPLVKADEQKQRGRDQHLTIHTPKT